MTQAGRSSGVPRHRALRRAAIVMAGVIAALTVSACDGGEIKWTEQVKLHDGKVIQLKRRMAFTSSGFPVQRRGHALYNEFCYAPMGIYWKSKPEYRPEIFDIVDGKAYAKISLGSCLDCMLHGYPPSGALYFIWDAGSWKRIQHKVFPEGLRKNLLLVPDQANERDDAHGLVTLADKERLDGPINYELKVARARGLNELPQRRGMCDKCRDVRISTDATPEVFLPGDRKACK